MDHSIYQIESLFSSTPLGLIYMDHSIYQIESLFSSTPLGLIYIDHSIYQIESLFSSTPLCLIYSPNMDCLLKKWIYEIILFWSLEIPRNM